MDSIERKNAELLCLFEVSKVLSSSFNLKENLYRAMEILSDYLDMRRGTITLLDKDTGELKIEVAYGLTPEQIAKGRYKIGEGIVGRVVEKGEPMVVPDIGKEPLFLNRTGARIEKDNISFLCVPIKFKDEILGVLSVDRIFDETISFEEDLRVLEIVATLISQALKLYQAFYEERARREELEYELKERYAFKNIIYASPEMKEVIKIALKIAPTKATVLLRGESGTGKELLARAIHYASPRANKPFIAINCAAIPETLLEAELFGYEKGAFTGAFTSKKGKFELADGGTLFLDEIGDLPLSLQAKLLRVLQEQTFEKLGGTKLIKVDVRIIAATHRNLEEMVERGEFREDLYWRLNVIPIFIPPLRERKKDIPLLVNHFIKKFNEIYGKNIKIKPEALEVLLDYPFPGNIRELENLIERLVLLTEGEWIEGESVKKILKIKKSLLKEDKLLTPPREDFFKKEGLLKEIERIERERILKVLEECNFNQTKAAKILGLTRRQLSYRLQKYLKKIS
ncbi:MAG: nif-specific transcriptional activator NifA [Caldimicrobium thiodismutans]|uniref:Nif-specific regulatory protein n=1 Tax=Caldimicrobium thiodismutans TaxID=1653476 RepID=A0A2N7PIR3_9BACT|nr:MAG: nif-specific transcriptional activator NifA [Caldimicrobium thiodismutans]